jgi:hypothetical protein
MFYNKNDNFGGRMRADRGRVKMGIVRIQIIIILVCIGLLVSCAYPPSIIPETSVTTPVSVNTPGLPESITDTPAEVSPYPTIPQTPASSASPQVTDDIEGESTSVPAINSPTHYELDAVFDYNQHSLTVSETIRYVNNTPDALAELVLVIESNRWAGSFSLSSFSWEDGKIVENYQLQEDQLYIPLPDSLAHGDALGFQIMYSLQLPPIPAPSETSRPQPYGYTPRQTNIVDWYPYIPPYQSGEGWLVHPHWWFGEHQVYEAADYDVRLSMDEAVQDLVIAASAPAEMDGDTYVYHLESARSFALSASNEYVMQTTRIGGVDIYSYSFLFDNDAGEEVLQNTADAMQLFSQLIIPYPNQSLTVVEADFLDGMEYDGLFFLSHGFYDLYDGTPKGYLTFIAAHETAHQWWYGLVGNDQALEPWLDEAMCTYMENIFYENIYADYPSDSSQSMLDWWWYYRVNFYGPGGWVDGSIYDFNQFRPYRDSVYLNGAKFLQDLRSLIGDDAFFAFLREYARSNQHQIATATDFFTSLRENTTEDLDALLQTYFQTPK